MKMSEFLTLSDDDKVKLMDQHEKKRDWGKTTEDRGKCVNCDATVSVKDYCFGCHKLICEDCIEKEPHYSQCYAKELRI